MSHEMPSRQEEAALAQLLRAAAAEAPPPDLAGLQALRDRAADAFAAGGEASDQASADAPAGNYPAIQPSAQWRRNPMVSVLLRAATAAVAACTLFIMWLLSGGSPSLSAAPAFDAVLRNLQAAHTLHLQVVTGPSTAQIWVRAPGLVRRELSAEQYEIAAGSRLWRIDESTNVVTEGDSPWFLNPQHPVDLLRLLDVGVTDGSALMAATPSARVERDGRECLAYRVTLPGEQGPLQLEALADSRTMQLVEITAWPQEGRRENQRPLAEMRLVAVNVEVADEQFAVSQSLTEDGRIGQVADAQGLVVLRPMLQKRWTPVCRDLAVKPGDWLRADRRGANAVRVRLTSEVELTLGPGALLECISPAQARLHTGEVQVALPAAPVEGRPAPGSEPLASFELLAPRDGRRQIARGATQLLRVSPADNLVEAPQKPLWLAGFEGTSNNESLGSLIVNLPDGRNEPLSVGYHKVSVEIRDQIARTTIEESFVNHTIDRLEGVFHFPLPQDASISGFGMWIGNELVEADIVEKQRAREIYETILREKRDPGLLEWTSGNLFKARVFPIEPRSEKRIKIVYTQVLPLRANRYRYGYSLRSELLRTRPVRELSLTVTVNSALPLKSVSCPTHPVRTQLTANSAQLEFAAQAYSPTRDFEVVCEIDRTQSDVVLVPHRRGDDGYFLLQLTPPTSEGNWQRELLRDGRPLNLVLLCDTSASMSADKRAQQADFVAAVLASLGQDDRFQLACVDVGLQWAAKEPQTASAENVAAARLFLAERLSLGWTDLDQAFDEGLRRAPAGAQLVYIGDGIVSAGDTDPASFVRRLALRFAARDSAAGDDVTFHAVTVGNTHEAAVLRGIASVGGGSLRAIAGEATPQVVALELLNELSQPGLRDVKVEFRGFRVAAVYPDLLPNIPAGTQQLLVGRYLPEGADQQGEVIVTGRRGSEQVRYAASVTLKDAESGNSFIPRLWARGHLDHLLAQGATDVIRDEIIGLSEEFHIMTPYTSLLVLESDADRERFGVKQRFAMRDGERFFAEGRASANFELLQAQMKRAGDWRLGLRQQFLNRLRQLGRDDVSTGALRQAGRRLGSAIGNQLGEFWDIKDAEPVSAPRFALGRGGELTEFSGGEIVSLDQLSAGERSLGLLPLGLEDNASVNLGVPWDGEVLMDGVNTVIKGYGGGLEFVEDEFSRVGALYKTAGLSEGGEALAGKLVSERGRSWYGVAESRPNYLSWYATLFPALAPRPTAAPEAEPPAGWSAEALAAANSLLRTASLQAFAEGLELRSDTETFDPRWNRRASVDRRLVLWSNRAWLQRPLAQGSHSVLEFCDDSQRGAYSLAFLLGRTRAAAALDLSPQPLGLQDFSLAPVFLSHPASLAKVETAGNDRVTLTISWKNSQRAQRLTIDTARHVVVKHEIISDEGQVTQTTNFDDFVELAGSWWARRITLLDEKQRQIGVTKLTLQVHDSARFQERRTEELAAMSSVQFAREPRTSLRVARQQAADGSADFDARLAMIFHNAGIQQWEELWKHVDAAEQLAQDKPGVRWMRTMLQIAIRRNEEARQRLFAEADKLAAEARQDDLHLAEFILNSAYSLSSWPEFYELVQRLKPVFERQPPELEAMPRWQRRVVQCYDALGRQAEALELVRTMVEAAPWQVDLQVDYARRLLTAGQTEAAYARLQAELDRDVERTPYDHEVLWSGMAEMYRGQARWADLLAFTSKWIASEPGYAGAYGHHLSALVFNDRMDQANELTENWLTSNRLEGKLAPHQLSQLETGISFASGQGYQLSFYRMDPRWYDAIADTIRFFIRHRHHSDIGTRGIGGHYFWQSDVADQLRGEFLVALQTRLAELTPVQAQTMVGWASSGRLALPVPLDGRTQLDASEVSDAVWQAIAEQLKARWAASEEPVDRHLLAEALRTIYGQRFAKTLLLPFLRERLAAATPEYRDSYQAQLLDALLAAEWSEEREQEAFRLVPQMANADADQKYPWRQLAQQIRHVQRVTDTMINNRVALADRQLNDQGERNQLTRQELATQRADLRRTARQAVRDRLAAEAAATTGTLAPWLRIEHARLDVELEQHPAEVEQICWQILGESPQLPESDEVQEWTGEARSQRYLEAALRERALTTVMFLAARHKAPPESAARVLRYLDAGIELGQEAADAWRSLKFEMLVVLDRPDELEDQLRSWIRTGDSTAPWRQVLARLRAERGHLDEALQLFEAVEKDRLLSSQDYRAMADWYLADNRRAAYERARIESFKQSSEGSLANVLNRSYRRWYQAAEPLPSELEEETLLAARALFEKSGRPERYLSSLRNLFEACRDFRLLEVLPDAVLGRSPQQIYAYLQELESNVLHQLLNEATADSILARIGELRQAERTPTDLRALDLMEAMIERKSSEVLNQPGPHAEACLAALKRAFARDWSEGELPMMATLLRQLGHLKQPALIDEQLRELRELRKLSASDHEARLVITHDLCHVLFWAYGKKDEALGELASEIRAFRQAHDGVWPHQHYGVLDGLIAMHFNLERFAAAEALVQDWSQRPLHDQQRGWMHAKLLAVFNRALAAGGEVSLGREDALFRRLLALELEDLAAAADDPRRERDVQQVLETLRIGHSRKLPETAAAVQHFVFTVLPELLPRQQSDYHDVAAEPVQLVVDVLGPRTALQYVVERMEQFPRRLELTWHSGWQTLSHQLAQRRHQAQDEAKLDLGDLEQRALNLIVAALQQQLRLGEFRNPYAFHSSYNYYWEAKRDDFLRAAEAVLAERRTSGRHAVFVADYVWNGLRLYPRSIEILLVAYRAGILDEGAQVTLVERLQQQDRHAESIAILEPLVEARPDVMSYRTMLMLAYHRTQRPEQLAQLVTQTHEHFHSGGRWTEANIRIFGQGCSSCERWDAAIGYFEEAIALHQRSGSSTNDHVLSDMYQHVARAQSALGRTREAVDAASAAIVCWDSRHEHRQTALNTLQQVLDSCQDLTAYVKSLDEQAAKMGQDSPLLRKFVGRALEKRKAFAEATTQYLLSLELHPHDAEVFQSLIGCYDALQDQNAATRQLLRLIDLQPQNLPLYQQLATRLSANEEQAERAATSIIEAAPNEAENHAALAELRQQQQRWSDAIPHWRQVAELRRLEPQGLLKLAEVQVRLQDWDAARATIGQLQRTAWPSRFTDVAEQTRRLQDQLPRE